MINNANKQKCQIFIISLEHSHARREMISSRLQHLGLSFEFHSGVDGRKLELLQHPNYASLKRRLFYGRDLSSGEFGCVLAHRKIYRHMLENKIANAVVLEDDVILTDDFPEIIEALVKRPEEWDIVRFLGRQKNYSAMQPIAELKPTSSKLARTYGIPGGAYGYLLNLKAAERLFSMTENSWLAIDTLHGMSWLTNLKTLATMPSPVLPNDDVPSCIDEIDNNLRWDKSRKIPRWMVAIYPITRGLWKLYLNVCNQYAWRFPRS